LVSITDVKNYLGIDYSDEMIDANINRMIKSADSYLKGAIGEDYPSNDPRAVELALMIISDLYDNRDLADKSSGNVRRFIQDATLQLKLELQRSGS
jgi:uncharacterized phage protein (predicted DNA packaging)